MNLTFKPETPEGKAISSLWNRLQENHGQRAELRRCRNISEVMLTPTYQHFCRRHLKELPARDPRIAAVVGLVSHLKENPFVAQNLAQSMSELAGDRPVVSELRFRRLLERSREELYPALIRILRMLGGKTNIYDLASDIYWWGDGVRKEWAFTYYPRVPDKTATA